MESNTIFRNVKSISEELNQASTRLNEIIKQAEEELRSYNIGFDSWHNGHINITASKKQQGKYTVTTLGWAKFKGKQQLIIHRYDLAPEFVKFQRQGPAIIHWPQDRILEPEMLPLKEGTRNERLFAVEHLEELSEEIENQLLSELGLIQCAEARMESGKLRGISVLPDTEKIKKKLQLVSIEKQPQ